VQPGTKSPHLKIHDTAILGVMMSSSLQNGIDAAKAGRMQEALDFLKDAIIDEPQNANVWVWIAAIIEDIDKQEIFLKKALEIDPNNKPAHRGMSFVRKKKSGERSTEGEHLSDYTKPITPFPDSGKTELEDEKTQRATQEPTRQAELNLDDLNDLAGQPKPDRRPGRRSRLKNANLPRLSLIEIVLLSVVVIVFCFIGVLAASSLFDIDIPLSLPFLNGGRPRLENDPPYQGVFLYENNIFFDIQKHQGMPSYEIGIPVSFRAQPVVVVWSVEADVDHMTLIYETGEFVEVNTYEASDGAYLLRPEPELPAGLYCFQQGVQTLPPEEVPHWCFRVKQSVLE
jgi:tetratricopeptide (TPR) repeat protein